MIQTMLNIQVIDDKIYVDGVDITSKIPSITLRLWHESSYHISHADDVRPEGVPQVRHRYTIARRWDMPPDVEASDIADHVCIDANVFDAISKVVDKWIARPGPFGPKTFRYDNPHYVGAGHA